MYYELLVNTTSPSFNGFSVIIDENQFGFIPGLQYHFYYRARNQQGISGFSPTTAIWAGTVPAQLASASTSLVGSSVVVTWPYTTDEGGVMVSSYRVKFRSSSGTYYETLTYCDGSDVWVMADMACTVPMSVFTSAPFSLSVGDLIQVQVEAFNSVGYSTPSADNTVGVTAKTAPQVAISNL